MALLRGRGTTRSRSFRSLIANGADVVHSWILAGSGIGIKARCDIETDPENGSLVQVLAPYSHDLINLYAVYPSQSHSPQRMRMLSTLSHRATELRGLHLAAVGPRLGLYGR
jgi:DNA-binding transcriptional LysR family regulator